MLRILTGAALLVVLWAVLVPSPPPVFVGMMALAITIGCMEGSAMMERLGLRPLRALGLVAVWTVIGAVAFEAPPYAAALPLALGTIVITTAAMAARDSPLAILKTIGGTMLPVLLGLLLSYTIALRNQPGIGRELLILLFFIVVAGDTAAFYVGRTLGRRKLAPSISPKKTWEGALGGVAGGVIAALLVQRLWFPQLPMPHAAVLGVLLSSAGILGDLAESLIKRVSDVKDSSGLLPGHGGMLDRLDSLLFTAPILYYYYRHFVV